MSSGLAVEKLVVENPATNETYVEMDMMGREEIEAKIRKAADVFKEWKDTHVRERVGIVERFLQKMNEHKERIALEVTMQMGKPMWQAMREVDSSAGRASYMASVAEESLRDSVVADDGEGYRKIAFEPRGVVIDIASWNFPLNVAMSAIAPAVLAGNTVIVKHSSYTPLCGMMFEEMFREAGAPDGVVTAIVADRHSSEALFESPAVKAVFFTGSVEGGYKVNAQASGQLVDVGLELGGKDPAYVRGDADLQNAAAVLADAAFYNTGQSCCAVERIYVHRSVHDAFVGLFVEEVQKFKAGDPLESTTYIGPLTQKRAPGVLEEQVDDALRNGAELFMGGARTSVNGRGNYFEPTVMLNVRNDMKIMQEESFGPVIGIMAVDSDDEAVRLMNDSPFGLTASVWTRDFDAAMAMGPRIEAGTFFLNRADAVAPDLAWTGVKDSGKGVTLSKHGFRYMTQMKSYNFKR